jgi:hypothetical protein
MTANGFLFMEPMLDRTDLPDGISTKRLYPFILSFVPWGHVVISYAVAFYVRIGFGAYPRSCLDNPDLPLLKGFVMAIEFGLIFVVYILPPVWIGWLVIRWRQGMKKTWLSSTIVFLAGWATVISLQLLDPGKFWEWVWD